MLTFSAAYADNQVLVLCHVQHDRHGLSRIQLTAARLGKSFPDDKRRLFARRSEFTIAMQRVGIIWVGVGDDVAVTGVASA